jgi:DNA-binding FadR family transcriptional regulator
MHSLLASITRNPALELFVDILNRVMLFYFSDRKALGAPVLDASARAHERIVDAVIAGNGDLARHRMVTHLEAEADFIRRGGRAHQALRPVAALQGSAGSKRAEALARELLGEVIAGKMPPGQLIGSEPDLVERFGVSRAVWREAVRILEHHQVAVMKRGPSGGLFVTAPSVVAVAEIVAVHLERRGTQVADLMELRTGVELTLVDRVAIARSSEPLAAVADLDFHGELAGLAGNRVLELVAAVLIRLTGFQQGVRRVRERRAEVDREVARAHAGIVEAVSVGDRELARHRLRRHLEATTAFLS